MFDLYYANTRALIRMFVQPIELPEGVDRDYGNSYRVIRAINIRRLDRRTTMFSAGDSLVTVQEYLNSENDDRPVCVEDGVVDRVRFINLVLAGHFLEVNVNLPGAPAPNPATDANFTQMVREVVLGSPFDLNNRTRMPFRRMPAYQTPLQQEQDELYRVLGEGFAMTEPREEQEARPRIPFGISDEVRDVLEQHFSRVGVRFAEAEEQPRTPPIQTGAPETLMDCEEECE